MRITAIIFVLVAFSILGCEEKDDTNVYPHPNQLILFQVEHTNNAWGYSHDGILIDSAGNVGYFKYPSNWNSIDSAGYISEEGMIENTIHLDSIYFNLDKNQVFKNFNLVRSVGEGELTEQTNYAYDMGETIYSAFLFDSKSRKYKHVLIQQYGDWSRFNKSPDADQLMIWLKSIYINALNKAREK